MGDIVTKRVGFEREINSLEDIGAKANLQGVCLVNCCSKITGCQAKGGGATEELSCLYWRNLPTMGAGEQAGERYAG